MSNSKEALRQKIRDHFKKEHPEYDPQFYIQGSYKMGTGIRTKDDICDLDDGVYFFREPDVTGTTLQQWVKDAVEDHTNTPPEHKAKCIRNIFAGDYEIDMPVYYQIDGEEYQLAVKNSDFEDSDPKAMVDWFNGKKDDKGQLVKIVKYLKAWCDHKQNKMPSGLAMTILASNAWGKVASNDRDDIMLRDILREIKKALDLDFKCVVPVVPNDDLFGDYDESRKKNFLDALKAFLDDAEAALREPNQKKASKLWKKHLGDRFPEGEDKEEEKSDRDRAIAAGASNSRPYGEA